MHVGNNSKVVYSVQVYWLHLGGHSDAAFTDQQFELASLELPAND